MASGLEAQEVGTELAVPGTGEVVDLSNPIACASALAALREYEGIIREAKSALSRAIADEASLLGVRSFEMPDGSRASVSPPEETTYDPYILAQALIEAGMPDDRVTEIIEETISYRVRVAEAKKAAAANPDYAAALEASKRVEPRSPTVTFRRK